MARQAKGIYETNDGKLLRDRKACDRHNAWLDLVAWSESVIADATIAGPEAVAARDIAIVMADRGDELAAIMKRRPLEAE